MPRRRKKLSPLEYQYAPALAISEKEAGRAGGTGSLLGAISYNLQQERVADDQRRRLTQAVGTGEIKASDLSNQQRSALGLDLKKPEDKGGGGLLGTIGDIAKFGVSPAWWLATSGKNAATELGDIAVHTPEGLYQLGKNTVEAYYRPFGKPIAGKEARDKARANLAAMAHGIAEDYKFRYKGELPDEIKNIKDPTKRIRAEESYRRQYGQNFLQRFHQRPLSYLLDVGTVASAGAGLAVKGAGLTGRAAEAANMPRLASASRNVARAVGSTQGRAPLQLRAGLDPTRIVTPGQQFARVLETEGPGVVGNAAARALGIPGRTNRLSASQKAKTEGIVPRELPRRFADSVNRRAFQKLILDPLLERAQTGQLGEIGTKLAKAYEGRAVKTFTRQRAAATRVAAAETGPIRKFNALKQMEHDLSRDELVALHLRLRGVHDAQTAALFMESVRRARETGQVTDIFPSGQIPDAYLEFMSNLPPSVIQHIEQPTDNMVAAADLYNSIEADARSHIGTIADAEHEERVYAPLKALLGDELPDVQQLHGLFDHEPIQPNYVSDIPPLGWSYRTRRLFPRGQEKLRQPSRTHDAQAMTPETVMREPYQAYLLPSELDAFRTGMFRTDPGVLTNSMRRIYQDATEKALNRETLDQIVIKDANGEWVPFKNESEMHRALGGKGKNYTLLHPDLTVKFFNTELNVADEMIKRLQTVIDAGKGTTKQKDLLEQLNMEIADNAEAFIVDYLSAVKGEGYAVPKSFYKDLKYIMESNSPVTVPVLRQLQALQNKWRTWTLAYMPRWFLNTAVGSMFLNLLKGVWHPKYYAVALRHNIQPDGTLLTSGLIPDKLRERLIQNVERAPELPRGTKLGPEVATVEAAESGYRPGFISAAGYRAAQRIEDYFRTASFYHSLDREAKQAMREEAQVLDEYRPISANLAIQDEFAHQLMSNKAWTDKALDDVNRFSYNYNLLGGIERRYIRAAIPFWGWYRFITKFVWRLPLEYPGRLNIIRQLGTIGQEAEADLGAIPPWARGALIVNVTGKGKLATILSTRGLNPIAQFGNPGSREYGTIAGLVNPGQLSPILQATLSAAGYNPATGETVGMSPEEPYGHDFWGNLINLTGQGSEATPGQAASARRFFGTLLRSVPQVRIGEQYMAGGRSVYPESLPIPGEVRPIPVRDESRKNESPLGMLLQYSGLSPRTLDLKNYQDILESRVSYAKSERKRRLRKQRKALKNG